MPERGGLNSLLLARDGLRMAQVVGLTSTAFLAGKMFTQSSYTTPALLELSSPQLSRQWQRMRAGSRKLDNQILSFSACTCAWFAFRGRLYSLPPISTSLYALSTCLLLLAAGSSSSRVDAQLEKLATVHENSPAWTAVGVAEEEERLRALVDWWAKVSLRRALVVGLAAGCAAWASVTPV